MKCERCEREATVHELRVANGKKIERHLCDECAREDGIAVPGTPSVPDLIEKVLTPLAGAAAKGEAAKAPAEPTCPACGTTYSQFRQSGQLGCAACYEAFESQLGPLLERWHEGGSHHVGKVPKRAAGTTGAHANVPAAPGATPARVAESLLGNEQQRAKKVQSLQKQLDEAVRAEQYERAASLRDEIRRLHGPEGTIHPGPSRGPAPSAGESGA
jgi:protein arginine kinase activator